MVNAGITDSPLFRAVFERARVDLLARLEREERIIAALRAMGPGPIPLQRYKDETDG